MNDLTEVEQDVTLILKDVIITTLTQVEKLFKEMAGGKDPDDDMYARGSAALAMETLERLKPYLKENT